MKLPLAYGVFALIATGANIGAQDMFLRAYAGALDISLSVLVGTAVGLVAKYVLDKRFIFRFRTRGLIHGSRTFALYTLMGLVTTAVFWAFEFGFHHVFGTKAMRYVGAVVGLAIGYVLKYHLDKRYVFRPELR